MHLLGRHAGVLRLREGFAPRHIGYLHSLVHRKPMHISAITSEEAMAVPQPKLLYFASRILSEAGSTSQ
jgi:hypothetical protein